MNTILTLPDGSAFDSRYVAAITWDKARGTGEYASPAGIRVFGTKEGFLGGKTMEQVHYCRMDSDEAARKACEALVHGWTGRALMPADEAH